MKEQKPATILNGKKSFYGVGLKVFNGGIGSQQTKGNRNGIVTADGTVEIRLIARSGSGRKKVPGRDSGNAAFDN